MLRIDVTDLLLLTHSRYTNFRFSGSAVHLVPKAFDIIRSVTDHDLVLSQAPGDIGE